MSTKDKIIAACVIAIVAVGFIAVFANNDTSTISAESGCSSESRQFHDLTGTIWSASEIEYSNMACKEAVSLSEKLAMQNVGLPVRFPKEWICKGDHCYRGDQSFSFIIKYIEGG